MTLKALTEPAHLLFKTKFFMLCGPGFSGYRKITALKSVTRQEHTPWRVPHSHQNQSVHRVCFFFFLIRGKPANDLLIPTAKTPTIFPSGASLQTSSTIISMPGTWKAAWKRIFWQVEKGV